MKTYCLTATDWVESSGVFDGRGGDTHPTCNVNLGVPRGKRIVKLGNMLSSVQILYESQIEARTGYVFHDIGLVACSTQELRTSKYTGLFNSRQSEN